MARVHSIHRAATATGDVIFVHGLDGDARLTWGFGQPISWHSWLSSNRPDLNLWSIEYQVAASEWTGGSMPLSDRALNILALLDNRSIGSRPIVFIGHSMGGLLIKEMLRHAFTVTKRFRHVVLNTKAVVFFSTPHTGSSIADMATFFGFVFRQSIAVSEITAQHSRLRDLNLWFRNNYESLDLQTCIFFETKDTAGVRVVNETSSDPGIAGVSPIPIDANHVSIVKPDAYENIVVGQTLKIIDGAIPSTAFSYDPDRQFECSLSDTTKADSIHYSAKFWSAWQGLKANIRRALPSLRWISTIGAIIAIPALTGAAAWISPAFCSAVMPFSYCRGHYSTPSLLRIGDTISISQNIGDPLFIFGFETRRMAPIKIIFEAVRIKFPDGNNIKLFPTVIQRNNQPFQNQYLQGISFDTEPVGSNFVIMFADDQFKKWATLSLITQKYGATWLSGCWQQMGLNDDIVKELASYFEHSFVWSAGTYTATIEYKVNDTNRRLIRTFNVSDNSVKRLRAMDTKLKRCGGLMLDQNQIGNLSYTDVTAENFVNVPATTVIEME